MTSKNKKLILVGGIILLLIGTIALTYAFFTAGGTQDLANSFSSGCLRITIENETNSISLENQLPITDVEGLSTTPYTFTIKNTCSKSTNYEINLESINEISNSLNPNYIKVSLSSDTFDNKVSILGSNETRKYYATNAYAAFNLYTGSIEGNTTKTFNFREWLDYDTTVSQGASKTYTSKINVIANPNLEVNTLGIKYNLSSTTLTGELTGNPTSASYCVTKDKMCTPITPTTITNNKITIELEESKEKQVVCTILDNTETICSEPLQVTKSDFSILAMYQENDSGTYEEISTTPTSGYIINEEKSYCNVNGEKDINVILKTIGGNHTFSNLQKGSNCYLYFDKSITIQDILAIKTISTRTDFSTTLTTDTTGTIYTAEDDDGTSYYFAGNPTDNWVKFAGMYWRIIRINGDGTIRMIYQGTAANTTGTGTQTTTSTFNSTYNNNMHVGYMYTSGQVHGLGTSSTIKGRLDSWYDSNLASYASYIDTNAGFCGDRTPSTSSTWSNGSGGTGTTTTYYGGYIRFIAGGSAQLNPTPTYKCQNSSDLYTLSTSRKGNKALSKPIGLITADEVVYGGGFSGSSNSSYYLYTGQYYWTMSPSFFFSSESRAGVFFVDTNGYLTHDNANDLLGVRPVINLKSDTTFIYRGKGTVENPYVLTN